jgi:DinB superfamily
VKPYDSVGWNLGFWSGYPKVLCGDLDQEQVHHIPEGHDNNIAFYLWHIPAFADVFLHGVLVPGPSIYEADGWDQHIPLPEGAPTPFGTFWTPEHVRDFHLDLDAYWAYSASVNHMLEDCLRDLDDTQASDQLDLLALLPPLSVYPEVDWTLNRLELLTFVGVAHAAEHLGEAQFIKGGLVGRGMRI